MYSSGAGSIGTAAPNSGASISWVTDFTSEKSMGWAAWIGCTDVFFEEAKIGVRNLSQQGQRCNDVVINRAFDVNNQSCVCGLESGNLLLWGVETTYEPSSGTDTSGNEDFSGYYRIV